MNDEEIKKERQERVEKCHAEIQVILKKYELALIAEDQLTPNTKVNVDISFMDMRKYPTAVVAQPENPKVPVN